jgi:hypothetical protein
VNEIADLDLDALDKPVVDPAKQGAPTADAPGGVIPGGFKAGLATRATFPGEPKPKVPIATGG